MKKLFDISENSVEGFLEQMKQDAPEAFDASGNLKDPESFYSVNGRKVQIPRDVYSFVKDSEEWKNRTSNGHVTIRREDTPNVLNVIMGAMGYDTEIAYVMREKEGWKPTVKHPLPRFRCTHVTNKGHQCELTAPMGSFVCYRHGANMKDNVEKQNAAIAPARMRIAGLTSDAVNVIEDILTDMEVNPQVRLKAAQDVLDRSGLKAGVDVNIDVNHHIDVVADLRNSLQSMVRSEEIEEAEVIDASDDS